MLKHFQRLPSVYRIMSKPYAFNNWLHHKLFLRTFPPYKTPCVLTTLKYLMFSNRVCSDIPCLNMHFFFFDHTTPYSSNAFLLPYLPLFGEFISRDIWNVSVREASPNAPTQNINPSPLWHSSLLRSPVVLPYYVASIASLLYMSVSSLNL
jgi:hypothetical protein